MFITKYAPIAEKKKVEVASPSHKETPPRKRNIKIANSIGIFPEATDDFFEWMQPIAFDVYDVIKYINRRRQQTKKKKCPDYFSKVSRDKQKSRKQNRRKNNNVFHPLAYSD
jgi:hypothetical protein